MKTVKIGNTSLNASRIALGCMMLGESWDGSPLTPEVEKKAMAAVFCALDEGINFFDHADIYTLGKSEEVFSNIWKHKPSLRDKIILQSKAGIRFGDNPERGPICYDFSKSHIIKTVEGSLKRLKTDYLDILLLHRPDSLVEPSEVSEAFDLLYDSGKVRYFGISNHNALQMELIQKNIKYPLVANQMQLALDHTNMLDEGLLVNTEKGRTTLLSEGTIEYCRLHDITIQAWSPLAQGRLSRGAVDEEYKKLVGLIEQYAKEKDVSREAIMIAWILRHPAGIQPVIGTTNPERIKACCQADRIELSRDEWYALYNSVEYRKIP